MFIIRTISQGAGGLISGLGGRLQRESFFCVWGGGVALL